LVILLNTINQSTNLSVIRCPLEQSHGDPYTYQNLS